MYQLGLMPCHLPSWYTWIRMRLVPLALVALLAAVPVAQAKEVERLSKREAREAVTAWSLNHDASKQAIRKCERIAPRRFRCRVAEWGFPLGEGEGVPVADTVESIFWIGKRSSGIHVRWLDFVWDD